ncbi:hypothetical protein BDU57DRAFT_583090 [Ampelomyces quisqualis]|uniref:Uncharacterized protein n=1 Tax=Ampelomyces quisqualis TaxID=50730 RepID=A0A6A5QCQ4_AMPQU|nr:hypothetical protein BDU57DRAFT_583090 [Ampelomyces quisqualis]
MQTRVQRTRDAMRKTKPTVRPTVPLKTTTKQAVAEGKPMAKTTAEPIAQTKSKTEEKPVQDKLVTIVEDVVALEPKATQTVSFNPTAKLTTVIEKPTGKTLPPTLTIPSALDDIVSDPNLHGEGGEFLMSGGLGVETATDDCPVPDETTWNDENTTWDHETEEQSNKTSWAQLGDEWDPSKGLNW